MRLKPEMWEKIKKKNVCFDTNTSAHAYLQYVKILLVRTDIKMDRSTDGHRD